MRNNSRITSYIHMNEMKANLESMKKYLKDDTKILAVVKADGYGHGALPVAELMEPYDYVWGFGVAAVEEGMELRTAGIEKPILVLGYSFEEDYETMAAYDLRPTVFTMEMAEAFAAAAEKQGICAPIHLAVDTGMSRIGFSDTEESIQTAVEISKMKHLKIEGVFTHFAKADELDKTYTYMQMDRFGRFCDRLDECGVKGFMRHCSNSAGILETPGAQMDLVRAGIIMYGIYPSDEVKRELPLRPVMELKSHVIFVKDIAPGTAVSYGGTFIADRPMRIATIPVGYADGYPRTLSNKGSVLIRGKRAPIIGRVCMDQLMVDVTGIGAEILDEVTLLGRDGDEEITVYELGELSARFPYEFVCVIGKRVPRTYIK